MFLLTFRSFVPFFLLFLFLLNFLSFLFFFIPLVAFLPFSPSSLSFYHSLTISMSSHSFLSLPIPPIPSHPLPSLPESPTLCIPSFPLSFFSFFYFITLFIQCMNIFICPIIGISLLLSTMCIKYYYHFSQLGIIIRLVCIELPKSPSDHILTYLFWSNSCYVNGTKFIFSTRYHANLT